MRAVQTAGGRAMHVNAKRLASASMRAIAEEHANGRTRTGGSEGKRVHDMPQLCRTSVFTKSGLSSRTSLFSIWREYITSARVEMKGGIKMVVYMNSM